MISSTQAATCNWASERRTQAWITSHASRLRPVVGDADATPNNAAPTPRRPVPQRSKRRSAGRKRGEDGVAAARRWVVTIRPARALTASRQKFPSLVAHPVFALVHSLNILNQPNRRFEIDLNGAFQLINPVGRLVLERAANTMRRRSIYSGALRDSRYESRWRLYAGEVRPNKCQFERCRLSCCSYKDFRRATCVRHLLQLNIERARHDLMVRAALAIA